MDPATVKSLMWLVIWGVLFFVSMRFGCGAHVAGHRHGHRQTEPKSIADRDPVCGMSVSAGTAAAASVYGGKTLYFCSTDCRDKFEREPAKYLNESTAHAGGHHA